MMAMCRKMIPTMGVVEVTPGAWVCSESDWRPPLQRVLAAPFWTPAIHKDIRNTLARPVVEPKLSASDAKFTTITGDQNFGQVDADVVSEATATGVCHIIPMAPGSPHHLAWQICPTRQFSWRSPQHIFRASILL